MTLIVRNKDRTYYLTLHNVCEIKYVNDKICIEGKSDLRKMSTTPILVSINSAMEFETFRLVLDKSYSIEIIV